jgi:hypothetical protein
MSKILGLKILEYFLRISRYILNVLSLNKFHVVVLRLSFICKCYFYRLYVIAFKFCLFIAITFHVSENQQLFNNYLSIHMALKLSDVLFTATETFLWYFNEVPVKRRGRIFLLSTFQ